MVNSWDDCFDVFYNLFLDLPVTYRNLYLVFEYVLPTCTPDKSITGEGLRPDVIILSDKTLCVVEMTQKKINTWKFENKLKEYTDCLWRYHKESKGMKKEATLLLTKEKNYLIEKKRMDICSPDRFKNRMQEYFGNNPLIKYKEEMERWLNSELA